MVKFGRHLQFYLEGEQVEEGSHSQYIVDYNSLRDLIGGNVNVNVNVNVNAHSSHVTSSRENDAATFVSEWEKARKQATAQFESCCEDCWAVIFSAVKSIPQARGAQLTTALKLYTPTVGITASQDLLSQLKEIHSAASLNSEALRKLVKKFDKQSTTNQCLSEVLLPKLYTSSFVIGLSLVEQSIELLRDLLDDFDDHDDYNQPIMSMDDYSPRDTSHMNMIMNTDTSRSRSISVHQQQQQEEEHESHPQNDVRYDHVPQPDEIRNANEHQIMSYRVNELQWLQTLIQTIPSYSLSTIVAHRGFHNPKGLSDIRPLENSLAAFEAAWSNGVHLCECDIGLTKDEKLVMAHDEDFCRLALDPTSNYSRTKVKDLTYKELIALTLKNGVRAPLLLDVLRSAKEISSKAQLVIEIKPGNSEACKALGRLMMKHTDLIPHIAVIMSFDLFTMHSLRADLDQFIQAQSKGSSAINENVVSHDVDHVANNGTANGTATVGGTVSAVSASPPTTATSIPPPPIILPKLMLLTVADPPEDNYELWVSVDDFSPIHSWLKNSNGGSLDGVYIKYQPEMIEAEGTKHLKELCDQYSVGVWGKRGIDPDDYQTMDYLVRECGIDYYNSDLPRNFLR